MRLLVSYLNMSIMFTELSQQCCLKLTLIACRSVIEVRNGFTFLDLIVIQIEVG